jgi:hypothetical protein
MPGESFLLSRKEEGRGKRERRGKRWGGEERQRGGRERKEKKRERGKERRGEENRGERERERRGERGDRGEREREKRERDRERGERRGQRICALVSLRFTRTLIPRWGVVREFPPTSPMRNLSTPKVLSSQHRPMESSIYEFGGWEVSETVYNRRRKGK